MSTNDDNERRFASRLLRRLPQDRAPFQISLRSLLIVFAAVCCLMQLMQWFIHTKSPQVPWALHACFFVLWVSTILGIIASTGSWWYGVGGLVGLGIALPGLFIVFAHDFARVPKTSIWSVMFVYAAFANLGGAIWWARKRQDKMAVLSLTLFAIGIVVLMIHLMST
jgi:hypothetical protein